MEARNERDHVSVATTNDGQRAVAFSWQLRQTHQHLRDQLTRIRGELGRNEHIETGLQAYCLAFCSALTTHHVGEDDGIFTELLDARPDLAPAIQNLINDHAAIAAILRQVRSLATQAKTAPAESLPRLRRELDGLAAIAESHFGYEERAISAAPRQRRDRHRLVTTRVQANRAATPGALRPLPQPFSALEAAVRPLGTDGIAGPDRAMHLSDEGRPVAGLP